MIMQDCNPSIQGLKKDCYEFKASLSYIPMYKDNAARAT